MNDPFIVVQLHENDLVFTAIVHFVLQAAEEAVYFLAAIVIRKAIKGYGLDFAFTIVDINIESNRQGQIYESE